MSCVEIGIDCPWSSKNPKLVTCGKIANCPQGLTAARGVSASVSEALPPKGDPS